MLIIYQIQKTTSSDAYIKLTSNLFNCTECGVELSTANKAKELIKGSPEYTLDCFNCETKYIIDGVNAYLVPQELYAKPKPKPAQVDKEFPFYTYVIIGLFVVGGLIVGVSWLSNRYPSSRRNTSHEVARVENSSTTVNQPKHITTNDNPSCDFSSAKSKAFNKVARLGFQYVGDKFDPETDNDNCSVRYHMYVKRIMKDIEGNVTIDDRILELNISYQRISAKFEYLGSNLYDPVTNKVVNLN